MSEIDWAELEQRQCVDRIRKLEMAIETHRSQKADDRCIEDDDRLYAALGDGIKCDRRVGSKEDMLHNCKRFVENRCEAGGWKTYAELEAERDLFAITIKKLKRFAPRPAGKGKHHLRRIRARVWKQEAQTRNKRLELVIKDLILAINLDPQPIDKDHLQMVRPSWFVKLREAAEQAARVLK